MYYFALFCRKESPHVGAKWSAPSRFRTATALMSRIERKKFTKFRDFPTNSRKTSEEVSGSIDCSQLALNLDLLNVFQGTLTLGLLILPYFDPGTNNVVKTKLTVQGCYWFLNFLYSLQENPSDPDRQAGGALCRRRYRTSRLRFRPITGRVCSCPRSQTPSCLRHARGCWRNLQSFQIHFGQFQGIVNLIRMILYLIWIQVKKWKSLNKSKRIVYACIKSFRFTIRLALSQEGHIHGLKTCRKVILLDKEKSTGYNVAAHL